MKKVRRIMLPFFVSWIVVPIVLAANSICQTVATSRAQTSNLETNKHPASLIGYTLGFPVTTQCDGSNGRNGRAPVYTRARVMDVSGKRYRQYEIFTGLPSELVSTSFDGWLSDQRTALVVAHFNPPLGQMFEIPGDLSADEFVVDSNGRFFSPTASAPVDYVNEAMMPFKVKNASGYLFAGSVPPSSQGPAHFDSFYKMNFDGSNKRKFPSSATNISHGCNPSPTGEVLACEVLSGNQTFVQLFDVETETAVKNARFGPAGLGMVAWAPKAKKFVYMKMLNYILNLGQTDKFVLVEYKDGKWSERPSPFGGSDLVHSLSPCTDLQARDVPAFANGSEIGQWSADGKAYYNSVRVVSKKGEAYNCIGAVFDPDKYSCLTQDDLDARYPALEPSGHSLVFLARRLHPKPCEADREKTCESLVQIYRYDSHKPKPVATQISHFTSNELVIELRWRSLTTVSVEQDSR